MIVRDGARIALFFVLGLALLRLSRWPLVTGFDELLGPILAGAGYCTIVGGLSHLLRRIFLPDLDLRDFARPAAGHPVGGAIVFASVIALLIALLFVGTRALAAPVPANAVPLLPVLKQEARARWAELDDVAVLAGQIEAESCTTLRHRLCWSPRAELKTSREYGFGLGQLTVTSRFNAFAEVRLLDEALRGWRWNERFDAQRQIIALVVMMRRNARYFEAAGDEDRIAFALASYNGGIGGLTSDKRLCAARPGCDYRRWFGHVERHSLKARVRAKGYGRSFFQINRDYVRSILRERRLKYTASLAA